MTWGLENFRNILLLFSLSSGGDRSSLTISFPLDFQSEGFPSFVGLMWRFYPNLFAGMLLGFSV